MRYVAVIVILLVLAFVYFIVRSRNRSAANPRVSTSNVIPIDRNHKTKSKSGEQPCSYCKKKNGKLIFYAQDNGTVVGLCKDCRGKAKKRDMLPL
ncbi:hypothetical protein PaeBR_11670 [Paenibacillus sp. BR2-3]|uniref:hypothetical protein n=1 Tax=Paenibacillus sp. BR2-3 TaxID=3048494 RepID=UPI0039776F0D